MPKHDSDGFQMAREAASDYLAHKKFTKESKLCYRGELRRLAFPKGHNGWIQWRMQFTPRKGEDTRPVEAELIRLRNERKLTDDEYARLMELYGLRAHTVQGPSFGLRQQPSPSSGFCTACGAQTKPGGHFCERCGAPVTPIQNKDQPAAPACSNCGSLIPAGKKFCTSCGSRIMAETAASAQTVGSHPSPTVNTIEFCENCGATLPRDNDFCTQCGARKS